MSTEAAFRSRTEIHLVTRGRKTGLPREVEVWFAYDERERKIMMLAYKHSQWCKNIAENGDIRYRLEGETSYHDAIARVYREDDKEEVQYALGLFRKKYGDNAVRSWYGNGEDRVVVEFSEA